MRDPQGCPEEAAPAGRPGPARRPPFSGGRPGARTPGFRRGARPRRGAPGGRNSPTNFGDRTLAKDANASQMFPINPEDISGSSNRFFLSGNLDGFLDFGCILAPLTHQRRRHWYRQVMARTKKCPRPDYSGQGPGRGTGEGGSRFRGYSL